jgi:hypothetical protein
MITIRFAGRMPQPTVFSIGQETDQDAEKIRFLLPQVADNQTAALVMLLPDGSGEALNIVDGVATVSSAMTEQPGRIRAWVEIMGGGIAWNSEMMYMDVGDLPPISEVVEREYPTAMQEALEAAGETVRIDRDLRAYVQVVEDHAGTIVAEAHQAAEDANSAAANAETAAQKIDGMTAGGHSVVPGAGASAELSLVDGHYHLELGLEQGAQGEPGRNAVVVALGAVEISFQIVNGHLIMQYGDDLPPQFSINSNGHLIYSF